MDLNQKMANLNKLSYYDIKTEIKHNNSAIKKLNNELGGFNIPSSYLQGQLQDRLIYQEALEHRKEEIKNENSRMSLQKSTFFGRLKVAKVIASLPVLLVKGPHESRFPKRRPGGI